MVVTSCGTGVSPPLALSKSTAGRAEPMDTGKGTESRTRGCGGGGRVRPSVEDENYACMGRPWTRKWA